MTARLVPQQAGPSLHDHGKDFFRQWISVRSYGAGESVYPELSEAVAQHHVAPYVGLIPHNTNPPACSLLALPIAQRDFTRSLIWWNVFSLICLAVSVWLICRDPAGAHSPWIFLPVTTLLLLSRPLAEQTHMGQLSLVLLVLLTIAWAAEQKDWQGVSGAVVGLAIAIKLFPGLLLVHFLARRNWVAVISCAVAFGLVNLVCGLLFDFECFRIYVVDVLPGMQQYFDGWMNASLKGFCTKLFDPQSGHVHPLWNRPVLGWWLYFGGSSLIVILLVIRSWRASGGRDQQLVVGTYVVAMLLLSPVTWDHYYLLLILPLGMLWAETSNILWTRFYLFANIMILGLVHPKWIWDRTIPGTGELAFGAGALRSIAEPIHTLTVISYPFYLLVLLFIFSWWVSGRRTHLARDGRAEVN